MTSRAGRFPFTAVVGQDDAKLALLLLAVDPLIGGVLLRGDKGSAKTTLSRGLADLLPDDAGFVELPLGATEDRLIGTLDLSKALVDSEMAFTPGLLAAADGGVVYVDEVNLLADHLVDTLLDVSVSGTNRVEREGISHTHDARFVLIGSMNPEEGELRPQLLDRFGLSVTVTASVDPDERAEAVRRRLAHDGCLDDRSMDSQAEPEHAAETELLASKVAASRPATISVELIRSASRLALAVGAEGLRADIVLCRAAAAFAGLDGRAVATEDDLRRVAPLVLAHRARRNPFDPPVLPPDELERALDELDDDGPGDDELDEHDEPRAGDAGDGGDGGDGESGDDAADESPEGESESAASPMAIGAQRRTAPPSEQQRRRAAPGSEGRSATADGARGRMIRDVVPAGGVERPIAVAATVRQLAQRRNTDPDAVFDDSDVRHAVRERSVGSLMILVVDTSGSMGAHERAEAATGTAFGLLTSAYERRDQVALITFSGDGAEVALRPTGSVEVARNRLTSLRTGGATPLAAGLHAALDLASSTAGQTRVPFIAVLSDGRATGTQTAMDDAVAAAAEIRRHGIAGVVLDCETGVPRLGLSTRLADAMAMPCIDVAGLGIDMVTAAIRDTSRAALTLHWRRTESFVPALDARNRLFITVLAEWSG